MLQQFSIGSHIFVRICNGSVYKTKIQDIKKTLDKTEFLVQNNSYDTPAMRWVAAEKCISIYDVDALMKLDENMLLDIPVLDI